MGVPLRRCIVAARAMGGLVAVSVLSGTSPWKNNTLPLHVEILYNRFQYVPAFCGFLRSLGDPGGDPSDCEMFWSIRGRGKRRCTLN